MKAQTSLFTMWILIILATLAVSIGHRVSLSLHLSNYQQERLNAFYLAKAGANRAIFEIINDKTPDYDSLTDNWANNEEVFKNITLNNKKDEFAVVSHEDTLGVIDEESKININTASDDLLSALLIGSQDYNDALLKDIHIWRGDSAPALEADNDEYKNFKKAPFSNPEELLVVLGHFYRKMGLTNYTETAQKVFENIKDSITIYTLGSGQEININTVSGETLLIIANAKALTQGQKNSIISLVGKIISLRDKLGYFRRTEDIVIPELAVGSDEENLLNNLKANFIFKSDNFLIEALGNVGKIKGRISVVYNRRNNKILYRHENY